MKKKPERQRWNDYINHAIVTMDDQKKIEFAKYFIKKRLGVVDTENAQVALDPLGVQTLTYFIYSVILEYEDRCK